METFRGSEASNIHSISAIKINIKLNPQRDFCGLSFIYEGQNYMKKIGKKRKKVLIITYVALILAILLNLSVRRKDLIQKYNESISTKKVDELNMSERDKLKDFEFLHDVLTTSMPTLEAYEDLYGVNFVDNADRYRELISQSRDDFEYYCTMKGIFNDIPSAHTYLLYPSYELYASVQSRGFGYTLGTLDLPAYAEYWGSLLDKTVREEYDDKYFNYVYSDSDGKYYFNEHLGIAMHTDEYDGSYITAIDGVSPEEYIVNNLMYFELEYDYINDKPYRYSIMFSTKSNYGRKVVLSICNSDNEITEKEVFTSYADEMIILYGTEYDEAYIESTAKADSESTTSDKPYYFYTDEANDLTYAAVHSVDYGFGEEIKNQISEIQTENIILDLRNNGGGIATNMYKYLYSPLFDKDLNYEYTYYVPKSKTNDKSMYTPNFFGALYRAAKAPLKYAQNDKLPESKYKYIEEVNRFYEVGEQKEHKNIYVLIGKSTASSADGFSAILKEETDAVLIGTNTDGEGRGSSYIMLAMPKSKLVFSYYPAISVNADGTDNSVFGTAPDYYFYSDSPQNNDIYRQMQFDYGAAYTFSYENRLLWDNVLMETVEMIKGNSAE